ncbi:hypothetical protein ACN38_g12370 [Penicillium nordicum]|uniref:Uncharacterized protein n=1 Tax=Penicillium nordicum TaxID=229535 RepID=A0A0M8NYN4_9EURO|nr:hypothetical protein ACN38_g12370 [Penicillium nordicum]
MNLTGEARGMQNFLEAIPNPCSLPICTATCMDKSLFSSFLLLLLPRGDLLPTLFDEANMQTKSSPHLPFPDSSREEDPIRE